MSLFLRKMNDFGACRNVYSPPHPLSAVVWIGSYDWRAAGLSAKGYELELEAVTLWCQNFENGSTSSFFSIRSGPGGLLSRGPRHPSDVIPVTTELVPFQHSAVFDSRKFEVAVL